MAYSFGPLCILLKIQTRPKLHDSVAAASHSVASLGQFVKSCPDYTASVSDDSTVRQPGRCDDALDSCVYVPPRRQQSNQCDALFRSPCCQLQNPHHRSAVLLLLSPVRCAASCHLQTRPISAFTVLTIASKTGVTRSCLHNNYNSTSTTFWVVLIVLQCSSLVYHDVSQFTLRWLCRVL